jgi:hypothetical protein
VIVWDSTANWSHWVLYDIPAATTSLVEGYNNNVTEGTEGTLDSGFIMYEGPYPPSGKHTYRFTVYALDITLGRDPATATRAAILSDMSGNILGTAEMTGTHALHQ